MHNVSKWHESLFRWKLLFVWVLVHKHAVGIEKAKGCSLMLKTFNKLTCVLWRFLSTCPNELIRIRSTAFSRDHCALNLTVKLHRQPTQFRPSWRPGHQPKDSLVLQLHSVSHQKRAWPIQNGNISTRKNKPFLAILSNITWILMTFKSTVRP